jgi:hypothetical protein
VHQAGPCCEGPLTGTLEGTYDRDTLETAVDAAEAAWPVNLQDIEGCRKIAPVALGVVISGLHLVEIYLTYMLERYTMTYFTKIKNAIRSFILINIVIIILGVVALGIGLGGSGLNWVAGVGTALVGGGIARFADLGLYKREKEYGLAEEFIDDWGILDIQDGRGRTEIDQYEQVMKDCKDTLQIQAISLSRLQNDLGDLLNRLGDHNVEMKILLMDPNSDICEWYAAANPERGNLQAKIERSTEELLDRDIDSMEVRYYDGIPINYFRVDDKAFSGPYFLSRPGRSTVTFLSEEGKDFESQYGENFRELWDRSSPVK